MRPFVSCSAVLMAFNLAGCKVDSDSQRTRSDESAETPGSASDGQITDAQLALKPGSGGGTVGTTQTKGRGYVSYFTGNSADAQPPPQGGLLLVGGGTDRDDAMQWFVDRAGRGDIVVLRASGADGYNNWLIDKGADSVESIVFSSNAPSSDPVILGKIRAADGIFFAGGDQSLYVKYWKDTGVEAAVNEAAGRGVPIGGTSAGLAILGQYLYPAFNASATSAAALADPFNRDVMIDQDFLALPRLGGLITDSHFGPRDRMGRLLTFMARIVNAGWATTVRGIGIDEETALAVDQGGIGRVFADAGKVYMLRSTIAPAVCAAKKPLSFTGVEVIRLDGSASFDIGSWSGTGTAYQLNVNAGELTSSNGSIY